jgi:hypothetical protein
MSCCCVCAAYKKRGALKRLPSSLSYDIFPNHSQLRKYISVIASKYKDNPFHNFRHATHVAMSMMKLLSRIVAPAKMIVTTSHIRSFNEAREETGDKGKNSELFRLEAMLRDNTYGITSDAISQFAVVLSALIHDVDHQGIANAILIEKNPTLGTKYKNKSVAEQNSVDLAWELLLQDEYTALRGCIFTDLPELIRFRQLIVNSVIATDIFDKEQGAIRKNRWAKAFDENNGKAETADDVNRKATIVIEHLIQASDVAHTMQHWEGMCALFLFCCGLVCFDPFSLSTPCLFDGILIVLAPHFPSSAPHI